MNRGGKHTCIGMWIDILEDGRVKIIMSDYVKEFIDAVGEYIRRTTGTPGNYKLFEVTEEHYN